VNSPVSALVHCGISSEQFDPLVYITEVPPGFWGSSDHSEPAAGDEGTSSGEQACTSSHSESAIWTESCNLTGNKG